MKQYKTQFQTWGWRRNLPQEHAAFMDAKARWRQQQEGKETEFQWHGQKWPMDRVQKSLRKEQVNDGQQAILGSFIYGLQEEPTNAMQMYRLRSISPTTRLSMNHLQGSRLPPTNHRTWDVTCEQQQLRRLHLRQSGSDGTAILQQILTISFKWPAN